MYFDGNGAAADVRQPDTADPMLLILHTNVPGILWT